MPESANIPSSNLLIHVSGEVEQREGTSPEVPSVLLGRGPKLFARDDSPVPVGCGRIHTVPAVGKHGLYMKPVACALNFELSPVVIGLCKECRPAWVAMNPMTITEQKEWDDANIF